MALLSSLIKLNWIKMNKDERKTLRRKQIEISRHVDTPRPNSIWRHYKGGHYRVIGIVFLKITNEPGVCYDCEEDKMLPWVQPLSRWNERVNLADGGEVARFVLHEK